MPSVQLDRSVAVLAEPAFEFGDRDKSKLAPPHEPKLGLDVALEGVDRHAERGSSLGPSQSKARHRWPLDCCHTFPSRDGRVFPI